MSKKSKKKIQKNKYLDKLGIPWDEQYANMCWDEGGKAAREWEKEREKYGFDSRETWDMGSLFAEWLYCHLKMYKKKAGRIIVLDNPDWTVEFRGERYTELQAINYILERLEIALKADDRYDKEAWEALKDATLLWAEILPMCWW